MKRDKSDFIHIIGNDEQKLAITTNLFEQLTSLTLIDCLFDEFILHFTERDTQPSKIQWLGTQDKIVGLFSLMISNGIVPNSYSKNYLVRIASHFITKENKDFKPENLSVVRSNLDKQNISEIIEIVKGLGEIKLS